MILKNILESLKINAGKQFRESLLTFFILKVRKINTKILHDFPNKYNSFVAKPATDMY